MSATLTRAIGSARISATTWHIAVRTPWPSSTEPISSSTSPLVDILRRAWAGLLMPPPSLKPMAMPMPRFGCFLRW